MSSQDTPAREAGAVSLPPRTAALAIVCAGLMATAAMPPLRGTGWLIVPALTLLFAVLRDTRRPALTGWLFGLAHQATLLHWLFLLGPEAPIASRVLVPVAASSAILYASLYYLLFGWLVGRVARVHGGAAALLAAPVLWTLIETLRTVGELGFPWCLSGMAWLQTPLYPLARAGGEQALGTAAAFLAALIALAASSRERRPRASLVSLAAAAGLLWGGVILFGIEAPPSHVDPPVRVAVAQADVALRDKWAKTRMDSTTVPYTRLTAAAAREGAELVVWAETAVPAYLMYESRLLRWVRAVADTNDVFLYTGFPDANLATDGRQLRTNASGLFGPDGQLLDRYAKHHLLPFGERMPFQSVLPWLGEIDLGQAEWESGPLPAPMDVRLDDGRGLRLGGLICYEAIFPSLARQAVRAGADVLVNITNDGWFGRTAGPVQHAEMARMRAAECGVPLLRCANNGISYITDPSGAVLRSAGLGERGLVNGDVSPGPRSTPYLAHGSWPLFAFLLLWSLIASVVTARGRTS